MKKSLYICLILALAAAAMISACTKTPEAAPTPQLTPATTPLPSIEKISDASITFIFNQSESQFNNSLYHQLAYIKLESQGYNISNLYTDLNQDIQQALASLESQGTQYVVLTSSQFNEASQQYTLNNISDMIFIQYSDLSSDGIISYQVKLYEYYYLAGAALCSQSTNKIAGFIASSPDEATIRCINAFALGMKSIDKDATVVMSWIDDASDNTAISQSINNLQKQNCDVLAYFMPENIIEQAADNSGLKHMTMSAYTQLNVNENLIIKPVINLDNYFESVVNTPPNNLSYGFSYLGAASHIVSYELSTSASEQTVTNVNSAHTNIQNGYEVFSGPLYNKLGLVVPEGSQLPESDILDMLWFVDNVIGELPAG